MMDLHKTTHTNTTTNQRQRNRQQLFERWAMHHRDFLQNQLCFDDNINLQTFTLSGAPHPQFGFEQDA